MKKIKDIITKLYSKYKITIFSSIIFTFITHFYYFTKRLGNEDDLGYLIFSDNALTSGRWNNGTLFTTSLMSPPIKFLFVLLVLSLVSIMICDIFKIKSIKNKILIPLLLSTFPTLALSFSYLFMVEVYMTSLFLAVFAIWITLKHKYGFILGSISIAFSLGNYQSYISISVGLIIIYILKEILNKEDSKELLKKILKLLIMGLLGIAVYFFILNILLKLNHSVLSDYKGANSMGIPPLSEWPKQLFRTYKHFIGYFIGLSYYKVSKFESITRIILILLTLILLIYNIKKDKLYKNRTNIIILLILFITLPLSLNIVDFMAYKTELSSLQIYNFVLVYIICVVILEHQNKLKTFNYIYNIIILLLIIISYQNYITTNKYYYKLETLYTYTEQFNNRLLTRIENTKGYNYNMPVMFIGNDNSSFLKTLYNYPNTNDTLTYDQALWGGIYIGYADLYSFNNDKKIFKLLENQFGVSLIRANEEERKKVLNTKEYNKMNTYPEYESIKIIDGILVVKF